jgi:hypothetical protein
LKYNDLGKKFYGHVVIFLVGYSLFFANFYVIFLEISVFIA